MIDCGFTDSNLYFENVCEGEKVPYSNDFVVTRIISFMLCRMAFEDVDRNPDEIDRPANYTRFSYAITHTCNRYDCGYFHAPRPGRHRDRARERP